MANVSITALTAYTDAASTDVLPIVDVGANITKKISISDILKATPAGTAALPAMAIDGDPNTGIWSPGADTLAVSTGGSERLRITSGGLIGIGTSSPSNTAGFSQQLEIAGNLPCVSINNTGTGANKYSLGVTGSGAFAVWDNTASAHRLFINSSGNVGIGTTSPSDTSNFGNALDVNGTTGSALYVRTNGSVTNFGVIGHYGTDFYVSNNSNGPIRFFANGSERARIDSSGRLLVGTSSSSGVNIATFQGNSSLSTGTGIVNIALGNTSPGTTDQLGRLQFTDSGHNSAAEIVGQRDGGTWNTSTSRPTRLVFSTTADGASSPTERMRISSTGTSVTFATAANVIGAASDQAAGTTYYLFYGANNATGIATGTTCFLVYTNGNVQNTNNSYAGISDIKLKENIVDAGSQWNDLKSLQVRKYNFKEGQTHTQIGLVAQEVELVSPGLVTESPDRDEDGNDLGTVTKSVNYSVLYMKAVKALQEAMERIETLEAKVAALEAS